MARVRPWCLQRSVRVRAAVASRSSWPRYAEQTAARDAAAGRPRCPVMRAGPSDVAPDALATRLTHNLIHGRMDVGERVGHWRTKSFGYLSDVSAGVRRLSLADSS